MKLICFLISMFFLLTAQAEWHGCFSEFNSLFSLVTKSSISSNQLQLQQLESLEDLDVYLNGKNLLSEQSFASAEHIKNHNLKIKELLNQEPIPSEIVEVEGRSFRGGVSKDEARTLYDDMVKTPCVKNDFSYERPGVSLGYCFGRAIIASMHGLKRSVHPSAMKKIWVAGEMQGNWGHHVALMIRGNRGEWFVIDNVTGLVTHDEWIKRMENQFRKNKDLMFFITRPERFGPESSESMNSLNLFNVRNSQWLEFEKDNDYYLGFFKDFFEWFDSQDEVIPFL